MATTYVVITKDTNGAPAEAYRGPHKHKAEAHKTLLLKDGKTAVIEELQEKGR